MQVLTTAPSRLPTGVRGPMGRAALARVRLVAFLFWKLEAQAAVALQHDVLEDGARLLRGAQGAISRLISPESRDLSAISRYLARSCSAVTGFWPA